MRAMPVLETERLWIRPFTIDDAETAYQVSASIGWVDPDQTEAEQRAAEAEYIQWLSLNHKQLALLYQPPYGDRAVALKETNRLIGKCGLVPYVAKLGVFPFFGGQPNPKDTAAMGLMWAIGAAHQKQGFATEVARALIEYAFTSLNLDHIIATTEYDNIASQRVMEKAGMRLERNQFDEPPYLQVMGIAENPET